jgi:uncharacterized secreted protein with C-terminal beta-propeller domain
MVPRVIQNKNKSWLKQPVDKKFAIIFLSIFAVLVGIYTLAICRYLCLSTSADVKSPAASVVQLPPEAKEAEKISLRPFASADEFKSYIDDGKRAYGDGVFESENLKLEIEKQALAAASTAKSAKAPIKAAAKNVVSDSVTPTDALKYFSLGVRQESGFTDIMQTGADKIFFSPESQSYSPAPADPVTSKLLAARSENSGETLAIGLQPVESLALAGTIGAGGDLMLAGDTLLIFKNNLLTAFAADGASTSTDLWQARISDGSQITASKVISSKLYLVIETKIDNAYPCPIKPMLMREEPVIVNCKNIYHPESAVWADTIYSVLELDLVSGSISKEISFVGDRENSTVFVSDNSIYAMWGERGDYTAFFAGFLKDKCSGLLPDYLLEKSAELPKYDISLAAKELELRALISNWTNSLNASEQERITNELAVRMEGYLRDRYRDFERTGIAVAGLGSFDLTAERNIPGRIVDKSFADAKSGMLRVATVSGRGAAQKMAWLVTGKIADGLEKTVDNIYILDKQLIPAGYQENLDLGAGICAIKYAGNKAFVSTCGNDGIFHIVGLDKAEVTGLQGKLRTSGSVSYLYPISDELVLAVSKNDRKIKTSLFDVSLASKPELRSDYDLNDYWADFDGNFEAFAIDKENKLFFLPAGKGGYLFSYRGGRIEFKKAIGNLLVSRAKFSGSSLYMVGENGTEAFSAPEWKKAGSINF